MTTHGRTVLRDPKPALVVPSRRTAAIRWFVGFARSSLLAGIGLGLVGMMVLLAVFAPWIARNSPTQTFAAHVLEPPSGRFWFGTDNAGMDIFSRTIHAARLDLSLAVGAMALALVVGVLLGLVAGYYGGKLDMLLLRLIDVIQAFPVLVIAIAVVAATRQTLASVALVIAFIEMPVFVRLIRSEVLVIRQSLYVEAARALGNPDWRILLRHALPNAFPPLLAQISLRMSWSIAVIASLAFVGVGISVPTPEWGAMIKTGTELMSGGYWWTVAFPGIALSLTILGFNLIGDALQDHLDPRRRSSDSEE